MQKILLFIVLCLCFIIVTACDAAKEGGEVSERDVEEEQNKANEKVPAEEEVEIGERAVEVIRDHHPETGQGYAIISTFDLYESYFNKLNDDMNQDQVDALFKEEIMDPIYEPCFADGEHIHMASLYLNNPPKDQFGIERIINHTEIDELNEYIFASLIKSSNHLPSEEETVICIFPNSDIEAPAMITVGRGK